MAADDVERICAALVSAAFYESDWRRVQGQSLALLTHDSSATGSVAAIGLGHIARIHGTIDREIVVPAQNALRDEPSIGGFVSDALEDIVILAPALDKE